MEDERIEEVEEFIDLDEQESGKEKKTVIDSIKAGFGKAFNWGKNTVNYVKENPVEAASKAAAVAAGVGGILLVGKTVSDVNKMEKTVYSDEINEGVVLKRKLTNEDKVELDYRMKNDQTKIEALQAMNLIK